MWYQDPDFWTGVTGVVAVAALVLSQVPPLRVLLRRAKIDVRPHSRITISHWMGNPNFHHLLFIANDGGRRVTIERQ